jgi:hypothetical protein
MANMFQNQPKAAKRPAVGGRARCQEKIVDGTDAEVTDSSWRALLEVGEFLSSEAK